MTDVNAVADVMGIPAELVSRSAAARATAAGSTTEDVLEAWGGGAPMAAQPPAPSDEAPAPTESETEPAVEEPAAEVEAAAPPLEVPRQPAAPAPEPASSSPGVPPVLIGARDNPMTIVAASAVLFIAAALLAILGPSIPTDSPGARTSQVVLTEAGLDGQLLYGSLGCAACHTQMVRPIVADVGIGPVTLSDTNQVLGTRRFGPDLSNIGNRMSGAQIEATLRGSAGHPAHDLSDADMSALVTYLMESAPEGGES
jgi:cytochrome c oxidase cbb3-type subunit II